MLSAQGASDAALGQLTLGLVFIADHLIPAVHKFLSWEVDNVDLGPIVPEWCGSGNCIKLNCECKANNGSMTPLPAPQAA